MQKTVWPKAVAACADPPRAEHFLSQFKGTCAAAALKAAETEPARVLTAVLSGSQALGELLVAHPDWAPPLLEVEGLRFPRSWAGLQREVEAWLPRYLSQREYASAFAALRQFKQREQLRIGTRDLAGLGAVMEITRELSDVADVCLESVYQLCRQQLEDRFGRPWHLDAQGRWQPTSFCVLGLGKLGGQELNYSSDVDVLLVYGDEGWVSKEKPQDGATTGHGLRSFEFFRRLAEAFVAEVGRLAPEGALYRIDLRLRPEGRAGPLARSLTSYESYYAQWGQTWERMMLIKARKVAGDLELADEFLELIEPFRYPRSLGQHTLAEIAGMKQRIETEVVRPGEIDRNIKLGRGGIREIEFLAQVLQVLHAGRQPFLADRQTVPTLRKLVRYRLLPSAVADALAEAYEYLRNVEHRLQMEQNLQTHTIPIERAARRRLAALMGAKSVAAFERTLDGHRRQVRAAYEDLLTTLPEQTMASPLPSFEGSPSAWLQLLADRSFRDPEKAFRLAKVFVEGPGFGHISPRTVEFARSVMGRLLALCSIPETSSPAPAQPARAAPAGTEVDGDPKARWLSDPDRVLARLDSFINAYGGRAGLFELWAANPSVFELLVLLFDRSEFLAEMAIRTPDLVDDLELSGLLRRSKTGEQTWKELRHGLTEPDQRNWLRRYHQTELMRIGLRDLMGLAEVDQNLTELSALADGCLQYALEAVLRRRGLTVAPLVIVGLGKLGGAELMYGSDLDVVFIADDRVDDLPALQRVAAEVIDLLCVPTELGTAFTVDARLRPDGEKGLLVNTLGAFDAYYRQRAQLWELQAVSRARTIAGNPEVGRGFQVLVARLTDFSRADSTAVARHPDWKASIARMRARIEKERTPAGQEALAIKTGAGGLIDAEFIAQTCCLANGWQEPNTLRALELARLHGALAPMEAEQLIANYRKLRRIKSILRRWSYAAEVLLPDDPAPLYRVAVRCGFRSADLLMDAVKRYRENIRKVYRAFFGL